MSKAKEISIDPVEMNIGNKIDKGAIVQGAMTTSSGVLVAGRFEGDLTILKGTLVVMPSACVVGNVSVAGDVYLLGSLGDSTSSVKTVVKAEGQVHLAATSVQNGLLIAGHVKRYDGCIISGEIKEIGGAIDGE